MSALGLCINAGWDETTPGVEEYAALGMAGGIHRTPIQGPLRPIMDRLKATLPLTAKAYITLNNECREVGSDWSGLEAACRILREEYLPLLWGVGIGNELDLWQAWGDASLTPAFAAHLFSRACEVLGDLPDLVLAPTSVASENWSVYLGELARELRHGPDAYDLHLYAKSAGGVRPDWQTIGDALRQASDITSCPAISSEGGIKEDDAGGKAEQARWVRGFIETGLSLPTRPFPYLALFSWHDRIGTGTEQGGQSFGLRSFTGEQEPSWWAAQQALGGPEPVVPARDREAPARGGGIGPGFLAWQALEPDLVGQFSEADEFGPVDGFSQIQTTNGVLSWAHLYDDQRVLTFLNRLTGERRYWVESWPASRARL